MALIKCPDCGRQVSDSAPACPDCARPLSRATAAAAKKSGITTGEVLGALLFLGGVFGCLYYAEFYPTTVVTEFGLMNNIGLVAERLQGLWLTGGTAAAGLLLMIVMRNRR